MGKSPSKSRLDYSRKRNDAYLIWYFFIKLRNFKVRPSMQHFNKAAPKKPKTRSFRPEDYLANFKRIFIMNRSYFSAIALAVATLSTGQAFAADVSTSKTREQVKAELAEAVRTGDIYATGESGLKLNQINPGLYPAKPVVQGKTREQVEAELVEAIRTGDIRANNESGLNLNQINLGLYPVKSTFQGKTREQVKAELVEAVHTGDVVASDESGKKLNELNPSFYNYNRVVR
jgi:hypothetical protein